MVPSITGGEGSVGQSPAPPSADTPMPRSARSLRPRSRQHGLGEELEEGCPGCGRRAAMRMPISRVRSVTETSITLAMPMPPDDQRDGRDRLQQRGDGLGALLGGVLHLGEVADLEVRLRWSVRWCRWRRRGDLALRVAHLVGGTGGDHRTGPPCPPGCRSAGAPPSTRASITSSLVLAARTLALAGEDADRLEGTCLTGSLLAQHGAPPGTTACPPPSSQHADLGRGGIPPPPERLALRQRSSHLQVRRGAACTCVNQFWSP